MGGQRSTSNKMMLPFAAEVRLRASERITRASLSVATMGLRVEHGHRCVIGLLRPHFKVRALLLGRCWPGCEFPLGNIRSSLADAYPRFGKHVTNVGCDKQQDRGVYMSNRLVASDREPPCKTT
eukprot:6285147-Amphidinium_carterae.1